MELYEAVAARLAMLGYRVAGEDRAGLDYLTAGCEQALLAEINGKKLPEGLFHTLADMVAGRFLQEKLAAGTLEIQGLDLSAGVRSLTEGDISVTFAGEQSPEARFAALLDRMVHPPEALLGAYRRLRW